MATDCDILLFDARSKRAFQQRLLKWYAQHRRDLPWRRSRNPYRVWVSEVMLQQTQVATVKDYFRRFIKTFPNVKQLAAAEEEEVLRLWEGLGYYRRARQLHAAAQAIVSNHGGRFPRDVTTLQTLPGIGRYTAGAIVSIAYDQPAPILEANTIRLLSRLLAYRDDPMKSAGQRLLWQTAEQLLPESEVADFNQALMELGSLVCKPAEPLCDECPVRQYCRAHESGLEREIPIASGKQKFVDLREAAVVVRKNGRVLMRRCAPDERWAGLWDFPRFELQAQSQGDLQHELAAKVRDLTGVEIQPGSHLTTIKHGVTRFRITLDCFSADYLRGRLSRGKSTPLKWASPDDLGALPLSSTGRKLARLVVRKPT